MKLSLDALKERAELVASEKLLGQITGGLMAECHDGSCDAPIYTVDYTCSSNPCGPQPPNPNASTFQDIWNILVKLP